MMHVLGRHSFLLILTLLFALAVAGPVPQVEGAVTAEFGKDGLSALQVDGNNLLVSGKPAVTWLRDEAGKPVASTLKSTTFDPGTKTLVQEYSWGRVTCRYESIAAGLRIVTTVENTGQDTLGSLAMTLLGVQALGEGQRLSGMVTSVDGPGVATGQGPKGAVAWVDESQDKPLQLQMATEEDKKSGNRWLSLRASLGGNKVLVDNITSARPIPAGGKDNFIVSVRVGLAGTNAVALVQDVLDRYRAAHPMKLQWPDRRPILRQFFGGGVTIPQAIENMKNPDAVQPPVPEEKFRNQFAAKIQQTLEAAKACNAQAVILWDLEGGTFPHATTYIGDPRLIRLLNPQMDLVADEGIQKLKNAGLKIGITLRPSRVIYDAVKNTVRHSYTDAKDPFLELNGKVEYARKRWGCEVFYVDTNFFWRPYGPEQKWDSGKITSEVWKRLVEAHPGVLFIPEFGNVSDYPYTVPYTEADMGGYGASPLIKAIWPDAFQAVVIEDADAYENFDRFVAAVRARNALMTMANGAKVRNVVAASRIYRQAELLDAGVPPAVAQAAPAALAGLLTAPDPATRFHAAQRLQSSPPPDAAAALLARAGDEAEEWVVRHAAVRALATLPHPPAVPVLVELFKNEPLALQEAAIVALAGQGTTGVAPVLEVIRAEATNPAGSFRLVEMAGKALAAMKAADQAPALEALTGQVPEGRNTAAMKRAVVSGISELANPASEPFLLAAMDDEKLQEAAAPGLVRIGTPAGLAKVKDAAAAATKAKKEVLASRLNDALKIR